MLRKEIEEKLQEYGWEQIWDTGRWAKGNTRFIDVCDKYFTYMVEIDNVCIVLITSEIGVINISNGWCERTGKIDEYSIEL